MVRDSQNAESDVAPNPKYSRRYDPARKNRCPGEAPAYDSPGLFGSFDIGLLLQEPNAIDPGSIVFFASP